MSTNAEQFLARFDALDRALVAAGFPATSPWWRKQIERFFRSGRRRWVIRAGRRAGKSSTLCRLAVVVGLWGDWKVPPGDVGVIPFVSVDRDEAAARLRTIGSILRALNVKFSERAEEIELADRPLIFKVVSATLKGTVGFTSVALFLDEVARWESRDNAANPAREVAASLRPTTASQPSAFEVCCSSPWGVDDFHAELFAAGDTAHQLTSFAPTWIANPSISEAQTRELEPDDRIWSREYGAEPGAILTAALDSEDVAACFGRPPRGQKTKSFIATDASSLRGDGFGVIEGFETDARELVVTKVGGWEGAELRKVTLEKIAKTIAKRAKELGVRTVLGDQRESAGLESYFVKERVYFKSYAWSDASKDTSIQLLRRMMREEKIHLVAHDGLKRELVGMKAKLSPSGRVLYPTTGLDHASALITLAHAAVDGDLFVHVDLARAIEANFHLNGGSRASDSPFEPVDHRYRDRGTSFRWGGMPGRGFG